MLAMRSNEQRNTYEKRGNKVCYKLFLKFDKLLRNDYVILPFFYPV